MHMYGERGGGLLSLESSGVGQKKLSSLSSEAPCSGVMKVVGLGNRRKIRTTKWGV